MKKLVVSLKSPGESLKDFEKALTAARKGKKSKPHFEVSFDNRRDFEKFIRNISILISIQQLKPTSINELAKLIEKDQSTLNKLIIFFEEVGVVKIKEGRVNGRAVKTPRVEYDRIEFKLAAA